MINIDTKWTNHPTPILIENKDNIQKGQNKEDQKNTLSVDQSTWYEASWTKDLYILAISCDPNLTSIRDLQGQDGIDLCLEMQLELEKVAFNVYGVPANKLRIFFHYHPQVYRYLC